MTPIIRRIKIKAKDRPQISQIAQINRVKDRPQISRINKMEDKKTYSIIGAAMEIQSTDYAD
jgi:hypothetical protein